MSIFLTGDIHGHLDINKLNEERFDRKGLTREDYMVILGDFGLVWHDPPTAKETHWLDWLNRCPWTTLVVLGNHENHALIRTMPAEPWMGGRVRRFRSHVLQLMDGDVFNIEGGRFFVCGGANSIDKRHRIQGVSWWPEEVPSYVERNLILDNLDKHDWRVDYVLTHEAPFGQYRHLYPELDKRYLNQDEYANWLQNVADELEFERWFFGHHHQDRFDMDRFIPLYNEIANLDGTRTTRMK